MIIDFHNHLGRGTSTAESTSDGLINELMRAGVNQSVVFPIKSYDRGIQYERLNHEVIKLYKANPSLIIPFIRFEPGFKESELNKYPEARGIKLHLRSDKWNLDELRDALGLINNKGLIVLFHSNKELILNVKPLLLEFPGIKFVAAHAEQGNYLEVFKACSNLYLDTSIKTSPFTLKALCLIDENRVLFGSDYPFSTPLIERFRVEHNPYISDEQKQKVLGLNAMKLLNKN